MTGNAEYGGANEANLGEEPLVAVANRIQRAVASVNFYPYVVVVERTNASVSKLVSDMRGTEWQPTLVSGRMVSGDD